MAKRKYYRRLNLKNKFRLGKITFKKKTIKFRIKIIGLIILFLVFGTVFLVIYCTKDLPRPEKFTERPYNQATKIYDRSGEILLYKIYGEEKRTLIPLDQIPEYLKETIIVTEDANFYHHFGIDLKAIARAIITDLKLMKPTQGGSTISQQLIRSSFLTNEKTLKRKIKEIILTLELERRYSKDQILGWYLNQIPFGQNCYGIEEASQTYFGKSASEVSIPEAAYLAALIKAPSYLSPYGPNQEQLTSRKNYILNRMVKCKYLDPEAAEELKKEKVQFKKPFQTIKAPHFVMYVKNYLEKKYGQDFLKEKGLKVYTTLDWQLQEKAEIIVQERAKNNEKDNAYNAAFIAISPDNGNILAMVGSKDFFADPYPQDCTPGKNCLFEPYFNVAIPPQNTGRQPGSAFKPFAYLTAFEKGYTPDTLLWDVKTNFSSNQSEPYIPHNYDNKFRGLVNFRQGLAQSLNIPSIKVLYLAGIEDTIQNAKKMGITTLGQDYSHYGLSLVLGGAEVKMIDLVSAYGVFATEGLKVPPVAILKIEDFEGNIIEENKKTPKRVLETRVCRLINDILSDKQVRIPLFGPHSSIFFKGYQVAAKTGTTQYYNNFWLIGYTPSIVTGVWVGNNDNSPMNDIHGTKLTGPIFHQIMKEYLYKHPKENFTKPSPIKYENQILNGQFQGPHSILYFVEKNNPNQKPLQSSADPQYSNWEEGVQNYLKENQVNLPATSSEPIE